MMQGTPVRVRQARKKDPSTTFSAREVRRDIIMMSTDLDDIVVLVGSPGFQSERGSALMLNTWRCAIVQSGCTRRHSEPGSWLHRVAGAINDGESQRHFPVMCVRVSIVLDASTNYRSSYVISCSRTSTMKGSSRGEMASV